ncbi:MAG: carbohydrate kinase [Oscillospiraceae bacterium]|nr:carbohydrate kinase [Oscillospiraceae bacterium]
MDVTALGELLIDFSSAGESATGMRMFERNAGGAPANVAAACAKLGLRAAFVGKVGDDLHGRFLKTALEREGVDTRNLIMDSDNPTTLAFLVAGPDGECEYSFYRDGAADLKLRGDEIDARLIKNSKILQLGTLSLTAEPSRGATLHAAQLAKNSGVIVACDVNYRPSLWKNVDEFRARSRELLRFVDLLKASESEAEILTGAASPEESAAALMSAADLSAVAVTLGENGSYVLTKRGGARVPALSANAIDTSGAGDTFWAGFLFSLLRSETRLRDINAENAASFALFGAAAASIVVEARGVIPALPTLAQVKERL